MDLAALRNDLPTTLDNLYQGHLEQDRTRSLSNGHAFPTGERDKAGLLASSDVKRSQPLVIQVNRLGAGHCGELRPALHNGVP